MEIRSDPQPTWSNDFTTEQPAALDWIWEGYLARGSLTLLTSLWKSGKTTLVSLLLARRNAGGMLAGLPVQPGKTAIITEENRSLWAERMQRLRFGHHVCFFCQPFQAIPRPEEWQALLGRVLKVRAEHGIDLLVIDPLAHFLRGENQAKCVLEALLPLRELTLRDMAVLVLHHPAKGERPIGQAVRGSGALLGHADIVMEMRHPGGDPFTRRRRFLALSRWPQTPGRLMLELNAAGTDYMSIADTTADDFSERLGMLRSVLEGAGQKLTRREILESWPEEFEEPDPATLFRWLRRAQERQEILCEGTGSKSDPLRYWLPGQDRPNSP